ncbi:MAG: NUDIX hydrolase, partial [Casimicrobiaceae bacterium]
CRIAMPFTIDVPKATGDDTPMNFCSQCGARGLEFRVPDGDTRPRYVCAACGTVHYQNPKVVVGNLPVWEGRVLLCRRAIEPQRGLWTLPAGFLENGETLAQGALRETLEEACARVGIDELFTLISLPQINQVYVMFRARLLDLDFGPGPESLEVALFDERDVPWEELAFRTIARTLRNYFRDRLDSRFRLHVSALERRGTLPPDLLAAG